jgi:hypothetical protein
MRNMTKQNFVCLTRAALFPAVVLLSFLFSLSAFAEDNALTPMSDNLLSYFTPVKGKIVSIENRTATADIGSKSNVKKGMRFVVYREGASFLHPVTKETIGLQEMPVGKAEVKEVNADTSVLTILSGNVKSSDKIRISAIGVRVLFYHGPDVDWNLGDLYYRMLKDTGRFELIDTAIETDSETKILEEAKKLNADVAVILTSKDISNSDSMLKQKVLWVEDSAKLVEDEAKVEFAFIQGLKSGEQILGLGKEIMIRSVQPPFAVELITSGDFEGTGKPKLALSTGNNIYLYTLDGEVDAVHKIEGPASNRHIWLEAADINKNGKSEIIVCYMKNNEIFSEIYEIKDGKFVKLWEGDYFLRVLNNELLAQEYRDYEGFYGTVFKLLWEKDYKKGPNLALPENVNIYDFVYLTGSGKEKFVLAYDENAVMNLYDENGLKLWRSSEDFGGFNWTFKKKGATIMEEKDNWSIKDKIFSFGKQVIALKRVPIAGKARGMGYSHSQIKGLWLMGMSMEESTIVEKLSGNALDYTFYDDKLVVAAKVPLGLRFGNILKGQGAGGSALYIFPFKKK